MDNIGTNLVGLITKVGNEFIATLDKFSNEEINKIPFEGSWTPGQVADHIIKATGDIPDKFTEKAQRHYDEKINAMESVFLDFATKYTSPDFVQPSKGPFIKEELIAALKGILEKHKSKIPEVDLSAVCLRFELPAIGTMTRYEWYRFFVAHTRRHLFQLNNMLNREASLKTT